MYKNTFSDWQDAVSVYGEQSDQAKELYNNLQDILSKRNFAQ